MKLYYDFMSQPCRAIYVFLAKSKINYTKCPVAIRKGEHKLAEFAEINPFQAVPAIDDNGFKLSESVAILRYLAQKYKDQISDHWYPKDLQAQAKVDEYMEWQHANTRYPCAMYFQHLLLIPMMTRKPLNIVKINEFKKLMEESLDKIENVWLKENDYIAGSSISFADLLAICELQQPGIVGYDVCKNRPKIESWFERVKNDLQPEYDEVTSVMDRVKRLYEAKTISIPYPKL